MKQEVVKGFGGRKVRTVWDAEAEKWYFSVVDVVGALTDSANPRTYWKVLKNRLKKEGNETVTNCNRLKLRAEDGKMRDNMTNLELILSMLAEESTRRISEATKPEGMAEHHRTAESGGKVARNARMEIERKTGKSAISRLNSSDMAALDANGENSDGGEAE